MMHDKVERARDWEAGRVARPPARAQGRLGCLTHAAVWVRGTMDQHRPVDALRGRRRESRGDTRASRLAQRRGALPPCRIHGRHHALRVVLNRWRDVDVV